MKLRIKGDSIRLRLSQSEVEAVQSGQAVEISTGFPGGQELRYSLIPGGKGTGLDAHFEGGNLQVRVPTDQGTQWASGPDVSLRGSVSLGNGRTLSILVEKDFQCLVPRDGEDESGLFPHPEADSAHC